MKIIDRSPYPIKPEGMDVVTRIRGMLAFGLSWPVDIQAQQTAIRYLKRYLKDRFTLICNLRLPGLEAVIPMILVGPTGVTVIYCSALRGAFQAQGEEWLELKTGRGYLPTSPNLILQTISMGRAIVAYLKQKNIQAPEAQEVLLFTHPRVFVETVRSAVRVVMSDAQENFAAGLAQAPVVLDAVAVEAIVAALLAAGEVKKPVEPVAEVPVSLPEPEKESQKARSAPDVNFTRKQWALLITLSILLMCILVVLIVILVNAH